MKKNQIFLIALFLMCNWSFAQFSISVTVLDPAKCICDGVVRLEITGGTPPYDIVCTNGSSVTDTYNTTITSGEIFCSGDYVITVTDAADNVIEETFSVGNSDPGPTVVDLESEEPVCGLCTGIAEIDNITGGTTPYTYLWSNSATTSQIDDLCPGHYSVTVTDNGTCAHVNYVTLVNQKLEIMASSTPSCGDSDNGTITVSHNGGSHTYSIYIDTDPTISPITDLGPDTYTIYIENDSYSTCNATDNVTVGDATPFIFFNNQSNVSCNGDCDGSVTAMAFGATSVVWSNGATTSTISNLCAGSYKVTITNSFGCTASKMATITEPEVLTATISCSQIFSVLTANPNGGTLPYSYEWSAYDSGGQPITLYSQFVTRYVNPNPYYVTVTDDNGCTAVACKRVISSTDCAECTKSTGMNNALDLSDIMIYPNPAKEELSIDILLEKETDIVIQMNNMLGERIRLIYSGNTIREKINIDVSDLPKGIYFVEIKTGRELITEKVIIQ